ncbi:Endopolyphosphatase, partial [Linderina pennispora]
YLRANWANRLDFVIWTGDSGRHDSDAEIPRTFEEIVEQNYITADAMRYAFPAIPVVPNIGNNDISPHNELPSPGHKRARLTYRQLSKAWHGFIPDDQMRTFRYGGYFARDVVDYGDSVPDDQAGENPPAAETSAAAGIAGMKKPKKAPKKQKPVRKPRGITVLSLNTIYWYRANAKVGGCAADDSPGLAQLAWIRYQLRRARQRNRDLILMGHVIPNRDNYRPTCYHGYARTVTQVVPPPALGATNNLNRKSSESSDDEYDLPIVHAQLYGHSNVDVWSFVGQEVEWITSNTPMEFVNSTVQPAAAVKDQRLWWEREIDEESGYFGKLIRDVWSTDGAKSASAQTTADQQADAAIAPYTEGERDWADMEDDPEVSFVENERGQLWPTTDLTMRMALPGDFVDTLFKEFERVLVLPRIPRLSITTISPSIIPKYFPAFRVFYYARTPSNGQWQKLSLGTLLDYDVYWANLNKLNKAANIERFFAPLYRFSSVYRLNDLSVDSYIEWARKLVGSKSLRKRFRSLTYLNT